jgi:alkanesulfonate monooxygenase SsuD/methylene tetrahydromethanopterin reductase-like flavin-dependent oxidoreductase (luciferase family)
MKLGLLIESEEGLDWQSWRTTYTAAERLGFESVWISDHLVSPWYPGRRGLDPWVALSVAAAETSRIRLGPLVSPITFHQQPALLERTAQALAQLAPNRFVLGLGLGWNAAEHARFGMPFPPAAERVRLLRDAIERIGASGRGDKRRSRSASRSRSRSRIPLLIGGRGPRGTLPLVARYADEWNLTTASVEVYRAASARLEECCQETGRDPRAILRSVAMGVLIGRDADEIARRSQRMRSLVLPLSGLDVADIVAASRRLGWVAGTPRQIVSELQSLADAGVDLAIFGHYDTRDVAALELIASDVMPALA